MNKEVRGYIIAVGIALIVFGTISVVIYYQLQSMNTEPQQAPTIGTIHSVKPYTACIWFDCETGQTVTIAFNNGTMKTESSVCAYDFKEGQNVSLWEWNLGFICSD